MSKFRNACHGLSESKGGMNLQEFKKEAKLKFSTKSKLIATLPRKKLEKWCLKQIKTPIKTSNYCECIIKVASKNKELCNKHQKWKRKPYTKGCYNPYAVCTKTTQRHEQIKCDPYYENKKLSKNEIKILNQLKGKKSPKRKILARP